MKKIKILFMISTLQGGGAEKVLLNLINNINEKKYDITLYSICNIGINNKKIKNNITYKCFLKKYIPGWSKLLALLPPDFLHKCLIKEKYDIEIAYLEGSPARIISGCRNKQTKKISWIHCTLSDKEEASIAFRNFTEAKKSYFKFDKIISVSKGVSESFTKIFNLNTDILYNVNETDLIKKLSFYKTDIQFNKNEFNIISVGSIKPVRAYDRLAKVQKTLLNYGYKTHIYILGTGSEQSKIEKYLTENNISDSWTFLGYKENPYAYVSKADLFVCSSRYEGFSTAVTEALICGVPCISTLVSGAKELLGKNNEYGIVTENNEDALLEGIKHLIDNPEKLKYYKKQAEIRGRMFSKDILIKQHEELFDRILNDQCNNTGL